MHNGKSIQRKRSATMRVENAKNNSIDGNASVFASSSFTSVILEQGTNFDIELPENMGNILSYEELEHIFDNDDDDQPRYKKKQRHTPLQIQYMKNFFKECSHPDERQRDYMSHQIGLEPRKIQFWFQNKRTQVKNQHRRLNSSQLQANTLQVKTENKRIREAISSCKCTKCGRRTVDMKDQFILENAKVKNEIDRMPCMMSNVDRFGSSSHLAPYPVAARFEYGSSSNGSNVGKSNDQFGAGPSSSLPWPNEISLSKSCKESRTHPRV